MTLNLHSHATYFNHDRYPLMFPPPEGDPASTSRVWGRMSINNLS
jgi:hypothetical protein